MLRTYPPTDISKKEEEKKCRDEEVTQNPPLRHSWSDPLIISSPAYGFGKCDVRRCIFSILDLFFSFSQSHVSESLAEGKADQQNQTTRRHPIKKKKKAE